MSEKQPSKRLILCVDGHEFRPDGTRGYGNTSNVYRLSNLVEKGTCRTSSGHNITQILRYHQAQAGGEGPTLVDKLRNKDTVGKADEQIKSLTLEVCQILRDPQDELFLYGFGRGAYIVRAIAGVLHHMGLPTHSSLRQFEDLYNNALALYKARSNNDNKNGPAIQHYLTSQTDSSPQINFIGLFDSVKPTGESSTFDVAFNSSIGIIRHALALNESSSSLPADLVEFPKHQFDAHASLLQAWFIGTHQDLGGGAQQDGLSLYPLQWMILESMKAGLVIAEPDRSLENPLSLVFPQFAGGVPELDNREKIEWQLLYRNGIQVSMFDLQAVHTPGKSDSKSDSNTSQNSHDIRLSEFESLYRVPRKIFDSKGVLIGWSDRVAMGSLIHPSVFCLWDRLSKLQEHSRFKSINDELAGFRENCMTDTDVLPPWLEGMQLQASGVKAFRILVCGKTGVGKSTLINKVFGVEMTEESLNYTQGVHDINVAFESPSHPGLLIHDSRGWQAGSEQELDLIAKFLRHRAFQKDPTQALHVIWFCVDSDVSRIEEADKRTFATIAKFSHHVPVFVIGTKKDKLVAMRKMEYLEREMKKSGNYQEASRVANAEADRLAEEQFSRLREQLSQIEHYKADGYVCLSKDDDPGVKNLLNQTLGMIADERVRLFCVAAQVVDVEQKIDSAITETLRLGVHAVRTAMVPLPFSGTIGTPTVSRILVEHILQCFGFPKAAPDEVESIMSSIVFGNLKAFMMVQMTQFLIAAAGATALAFATMGASGAIVFAGSIFSAPPTARMLLKCACDMILILERSFRYGGKYVSTKQIEAGAKYYTTATVSVDGKDKRLQIHVHDQIDKLIPLKKINIGWNFTKIRAGFEKVVANNRFGQTPGGTEVDDGQESGVVGIDLHTRHAELAGDNHRRAELLGDVKSKAELAGDTQTRAELSAGHRAIPSASIPELDGQEQPPAMPELEGDLGLSQGRATTVPRVANRPAGTSDYESSLTTTSSSTADTYGLHNHRDSKGFSVADTEATSVTSPGLEVTPSYGSGGLLAVPDRVPSHSLSDQGDRPSIGKRLTSKLGFRRKSKN